MNDSHIDRILDNLVAIMPVFHKKLLRMDLGGVTGDLTRLHLGVMGMLREGRLTSSELSRMSAIPKSQMTSVVSQLVARGIVERHADARDRRVINLALTKHGGVLLDDVKRKVEQNIKESLANLTPDDLAAMSAALETLRSIVSRL
jgi:DNA-binding MarR family transcriptional regulator